VTDSFRRDLKTFLFHSRVRIDSVMRPRSSSRGRNTSASVTVTVTQILKHTTVLAACLLLNTWNKLENKNVSDRIKHVE